MRSKVGNPDDAEDLLQEVLIKTYKNLQTVKDSSKIKSWIFQIANNTIIDFYRRKHKDDKLTTDDLWYEQEEVQVIRELSRCTLPIIKCLPEQDAELLIAIEIEGISQKNYAESHKINYSTLKSRVKKSRKKLYSLFSDCCELSINKQGNLIGYQQKSKNCIRC